MSRQFWEERYNRFGHTGWADAVIYAYDQQERLQTMRQAIARDSNPTGAALDFGCGTGDFSRLLLELGFDVRAYDPFVRPKIQSSRFAYVSSLTDIRCQTGSGSLALTVTVLDHILNREELIEALRVIRSFLSSSGVFYMLEYALEDGLDRRCFGSVSHQALRSLSEWRGILSESGFSVLSIDTVPHPMFSPSAGYREYASRYSVRLARRLIRFGVPGGILGRLLQYSAAGALLAGSRTDICAASPLKLIRCAPLH